MFYKQQHAKKNVPTDTVIKIVFARNAQPLNLVKFVKLYFINKFSCR